MPKTKSKGMTVITLRISPTQWQKLGWVAEEQDETRASVVRKLIAHATKGITPPKQLESRVLVCSPEEWANWQNVAAGMSTSVDKIVGRLMNGLATRAGLTLAPTESTAHSPDQQIS